MKGYLGLIALTWSVACETGPAPTPAAAGSAAVAVAAAPSATPAADGAAPASAAEPKIDQEHLITKVDFEETAEQEINEKNLVQELKKLEAAIGK
jgi:hypothetical protein